MANEKDVRDKFDETLALMRELFVARDKELNGLVDECSYETKLAITKWAMKHIVDHAKEGGSYRTLIYERLGFGPDAYSTLCDDGLTISNEFDLDLKNSVIKFLKNNDIEGAKKALGCCDEHGCFEKADSGIPTEDKYRWTCHEHAKNLTEKKKSNYDV